VNKFQYLIIVMFGESKCAKFKICTKLCDLNVTLTIFSLFSIALLLASRKCSMFRKINRQDCDAQLTAACVLILK